MPTQPSNEDWKEKWIKEDMDAMSARVQIEWIEKLLQSERKKNRIITEKDVFRVKNENGMFSHFSIKRLSRDFKIQRVVEQSEILEILSALDNE